LVAGETNIFQIGQKVKLSTGGPEMCVEDIQGNACVCRWFVNGSDKSGRFVDQCLVPVVKTSLVIHGKRGGHTSNRP